MSSTRTFCLLNGRDLTYEPVDEAKRFVLDVASGVIDLPEITAWITDRLEAQTT